MKRKLPYLGPEHEPGAPPEGGGVIVVIEPACPSHTNAVRLFLPITANNWIQKD
jgi:hypothetical protein